MKNSKVLSLLTAGALVVSSFSGLAMHGGVSKAADITKTGSALIGVPATTVYGVTNHAGYATTAGDFTIAAGTSVYLSGSPTTLTDVSATVTFTAQEADAAVITGSALAVTSAFYTAAGGAATVVTGAAGAEAYIIVVPGDTNVAYGSSVAAYDYIKLFFVNDVAAAAAIGTNVAYWNTYTNNTGNIQGAAAAGDGLAGNARIATYTTGGAKPTGTVQVKVYGTNYTNEMDMPNFYDIVRVSDVAATRPLAGDDALSTDASITFSKPTTGGVQNVAATVGDAAHQLLTYNYSVNVSREYARGVLIFTFGAAAAAGNGINPDLLTNMTYTLTLNGDYVSPATLNNTNSIAFVNGDGTARTEYTWTVNGGAQYATAIETSSTILEIGRLTGNMVHRFNPANIGGATIANSVLGFTGDANKVRNNTRTWLISASSSDESIVRVGVNDQSDWLTVAAYGIGEAVVTVTMEDLAGRSYTTSCTIKTVPGDVYIRLYNSKGRDVSYVNLSGDGASETITADVRAASYDSADDVHFVLVTTLANDAAAQTEAQHYVASTVNSNVINLNAVGNGSMVLWVYSDIDGMYSKYLKNSPANLDDVGKCINALTRMQSDVRGSVRRIPVYSTGVTADVANLTTLDEIKLRTDGVAATLNPITSYWVNEQTVRNYGSGKTASNTDAKVAVSSSDEKVATAAVSATGVITITPVAEGNAEVTVSADWKQGSKAVSDTKVIKVNVITKDSGEVDPEKYQPGDAVKENGVTGIVNEDGETVTVTDVTVVDKAITIPETVDELKVTAVAPQAFKKSGAKIVYVYGAVEELGKGAFKASKVKKAYFFQPAALKTVGNNAFKKTDAKVVGVDGAFSDEVASKLKKAGASKVKNNGSAK